MAYLSRPAPKCTILSSLDGLKALLVPQGFVLPKWHQVSWEKASHTSRDGTPYELGFGRSLKQCGTLGLMPHPHPQKRAVPGSNTICHVLPPPPHVHDIVFFGWPKGSLSPSKFCSSHVTSSFVGKGLIHIKGGHPLWTRLWTLT